MGRPRILLGDDHLMFAEGLRRILEPHFDVLGTAENGHVLLASVQRLKPDVVVVDVTMPLLNGIEVARRLLKLTRRPRLSS